MKTERETAPAKRGERSEREAPARKSAGIENPVLTARGLTLDGLGNRALLSLMRSGRLQRKARISQPGDPLEHEADRAADSVVSGDHRPRPAHAHSASGEIQRMPTEDETLANALGLGSKVGRAEPSSDGADQPDARAADVLGQLYGGHALDEATRGLMESRFGENFSDVRIHTGHRAAEAAGALQARAFTVGEDVVFGEGQFGPETSEGQRLLAHELAHVIQQRQSTGAVAGERETERDAREAAHEVSSGGTPSVRERSAPGTVQRDPISKAGTMAAKALAKRFFAELGLKLGRLAARKVAKVALQELAEGLAAKVEKHILEHTEEVVEKAVNTLFKKSLGKEAILDLIKETIKSGGAPVLSEMSENGKLAWVFEKEFKDEVGVGGQKVLRVVVDKEGKVVTAFAVDSLIKRIAIKGIQVSAELATVAFLTTLYEKEAKAADENTAVRYKRFEESQSTLETVLEWVVPLGLAESSPIALELDFAQISAHSQAAIAEAEHELGRKLDPEEEQLIRQDIYNIWAESSTSYQAP